MWIVLLIVEIFLCSLFVWGIILLILNYTLKGFKILLMKIFRIPTKKKNKKTLENKNEDEVVIIPTSFDKTIKIDDENLELKVDNTTRLKYFMLIDKIAKMNETLEKEKLNINNLESKISMVLESIKNIDVLCDAIIRSYIKGTSINKLYNYYIKLKLNLIKKREKYFSEKIKADIIQNTATSDKCPYCFAEIKDLINKKCPSCNNPFIIYKAKDKIYLLNEKQYYLL